ncbi:hypothetical protein CK485_26535 [Streptomyces sp. ICBB 8177]|nr:hypothetical protein CK485_26535 [Streptomyces sp. ICBB 8177]
MGTEAHGLEPRRRPVSEEHSFRQPGRTTDEGILRRISSMIEDEKSLRDQLAEGRIDSRTEQERLAEVERELDQCWDLLRQRRARAQYGEDPDETRVRPSWQVEGYEG